MTAAAPEGGAGVDAGPLAGLRVVEIATARAGAFAASILADLGADVVKVETTRAGAEGPGAADERIAYDRGKRSLTLDVATPDGGEVLRRLVARADVLVEEDVAWRGGDGPDLSGLVHCTLTPFGGRPAEGAPVSDAGTDELLVQALSGNMDLTGFTGGPPCEAGIPVTDLAAGVFAVLGVLAGLVSGGPHRVEVSKLDVAVALLSYMAVGYFADGEAPTRVGTGHATIFPYNAFRAADGEVVVAPFTRRFWQNFAVATGRDDLADDERYRGFGDRLKAKEELLETFAPIIERRSVAAWVDTFAENDVPAGPVLTLGSVLELDHTRERSMVTTVDVGDGGATRTTGSPFHVHRPGGATTSSDLGGVPAPGRHTGEVRAEVGADPTTQGSGS